jgi:replicative DNA helicase
MAKGKDIESLDVLRIPPQAIELEEAVIGAMLVDKDVLVDLEGLVNPEYFYMEKHRVIAYAIQQLSAEGKPVDLLTVNERLQTNKHLDIVGGTHELAAFGTKVASTVHAEYHARIVQQKYLQRELIRAGHQIASESSDEGADVFELMDKAQQQLDKVTDSVGANGEESLAQIAGNVLMDVERITNNDGAIIGVPTGLEALDRSTGGWQNTDLITIAARPGMGKTAFALMSTLAAARAGVPVAFFSLEMGSEQLFKRLVALSSERVHSNMLFKTGARDANGPNSFYMKNIRDGVQQIAALPLHIVSNSVKLSEIVQRARRMHKRHGIGLVVIDYMQLVEVAGSNNNNSNREQEVSAISRTLKQLAKSLNVPVIALSQLSRKVEDRGGTKKPKLHDIRESGAIEQDSDIVAFLYRAEYYGFEKLDDGHTESKGVGEVEIAKHRNGALGTIICDYDANHVRWSDRYIHNEINSHY